MLLEHNNNFHTSFDFPCIKLRMDRTREFILLSYETVVRNPFKKHIVYVQHIYSEYSKNIHNKAIILPFLCRQKKTNNNRNNQSVFTTTWQLLETYYFDSGKCLSHFSNRGIFFAFRFYVVQICCLSLHNVAKKDFGGLDCWFRQNKQYSVSVRSGKMQQVSCPHLSDLFINRNNCCSPHASTVILDAVEHHYSS